MSVVKFISISDIHLGCNHLDPDRMVDSLYTQLKPYIEKVDLLIIVGDLYDTDLSLVDKPITSIFRFLISLLTLCDKHNVTVRLLRGTFSHDRTQMRIVPILHDKYHFKNDLKYFDVISLEYLKEFDLRILYIPDDVPYSDTDAVMVEVHRKMKELDWEYVDYAFVHGNFAFAFPEDIVKNIKMVYRDDQFDFVKKRVLIGHYHTHSFHKKFAYNGSFERLRHGEEEAKGFIVVEDFGETTKAKFIENTQTVLFKTIDLSACATDIEARELLIPFLDKFPKEEQSFARLVHPDHVIRQALFSFAAKTYPHLKISQKATKLQAKTPTLEDLDHSLKLDVTSPPTPETLPAAVLFSIQKRFPKTHLTEDRIATYLQASQKRRA